jgi:hypothetical protein
MYSKVKIAGFPGWTLPQDSHVSVRLAPGPGRRACRSAQPGGPAAPPPRRVREGILARYAGQPRASGDAALPPGDGTPW